MILKRLILFFGIAFIAFGCNKLNGPEKPENLISKDKMVDILIDARFITSANSKNKIIMRDAGLDLNNYVYNKHDIDSLQFALSNNYYAFHIEEYEDIYTRLEDSLSDLKDYLKTVEADEWKEKTKRESDSLTEKMKKKKAKGALLDVNKVVKENSFIKGDELLEESIEELEGLLEPISDSILQ